MATTLNPVCILSGRGSAGKTFFALHLAQLMAIRKSKILLVDMDCGSAGLTHFLFPSYLTNTNKQEDIHFLSQTSCSNISLSHSWTSKIP